MSKIWYPKVQDIIINNKKVIKIHKETKAERHKILGRYNLQPIINEAKKTKGGIFQKASILLRGINQAHAFASANKRTAYFTANQFIYQNINQLVLKKRNKQKEIAIKVREGRITDKELTDWLKYPKKNKIYGRKR